MMKSFPDWCATDLPGGPGSLTAFIDTAMHNKVKNLVRRTIEQDLRQIPGDKARVA